MFFSACWVPFLGSENKSHGWIALFVAGERGVVTFTVADSSGFDTPKMDCRRAWAVNGCMWQIYSDSIWRNVFMIAKRKEVQ